MSSPKGGTKRRNFVAVSVGHFAIDVFNSMGPVLVAQLRLAMGLSAAQVGIAVGVYQLLAGATQPLFGWLVDRRGSRRLGPLSVAWVIALVTVSAIFAPRLGYGMFLVLFSLAAVGSGAFHPQGTMHAGLAIPGKTSTTTAIFFLCGQVGLSLGPLLAGVTVDQVGMSGLAWLALVFLGVPVWMVSRMRPAVPAATTSVSSLSVEDEVLFDAEHDEAPDTSVGTGSALAVAQLAAIFAMRGWIFIGTASFLPLLFQAAGASATRQGLLTGAFWLGGAFTGVLAGSFADRFGKRLVAATATFLGSLLLLVLPFTTGSLTLAAVLLCGGLLGAPHSVLMVLAQELLPVRRALAAGYALGFLFSMGAVASWAIGVLADQFSLSVVLQAGALPGLIAATLLCFLPSPRSGDADLEVR